MITAYQLGSLRLNLLTRVVQIDDVTIDLSVREFALLEYFLRHPHQALTRQQILTAVWPSDSEVNSSIVDTYIHYLRTKIERYPGAPQIHTKRSIGYLLTAPQQDEEESTSRERGEA
ncbi:MAG TPA: winged helix-turn-helix domain-containing protein [Ktedonobacteraceae bacterium]